jgi:hypothetical protein
VPHSFEQKGPEAFVILVNATPGWDPLKDTRYPGHFIAQEIRMRLRAIQP